MAIHKNIEPLFNTFLDITMQIFQVWKSLIPERQACLTGILLQM